MPLISVITPGRGRTETIDRCVRSVQAQEHKEIEHILVSDGCKDFYMKASAIASRHSNVKVITSDINASLREVYKPSRAANIRNVAMKNITGDYVAFLDDDNAWEPEHLSSLVALLLKCPYIGAAYSYRTLWNHDDTPYLSTLHPWTDTHCATARYRELCERGVYACGSNQMRDTIEQCGTEGEVMCTVDTSAWLLPKPTALDYPFPSQFDKREKESRESEDAALGLSFVKAGIAIATSGMFTLRYYLGGFSTDWNSKWTT